MRMQNFSPPCSHKVYQKQNQNSLLGFAYPHRQGQALNPPRAVYTCRRDRSTRPLGRAQSRLVLCLSQLHTPKRPRPNAARGAVGAMTMIIDYHALAKIPMPEAMPIAKTPAIAPVAPMVVAASAKTQAVLTGGSRAAVARHQTLRATIDWSYDLLTEPERAVLRRLSVFAGGATLEAAEVVCAGDPVDPFDVLDAARPPRREVAGLHRSDVGRGPLPAARDGPRVRPGPARRGGRGRRDAAPASGLVSRPGRRGVAGVLPGSRAGRVAAPPGPRARRPAGRPRVVPRPARRGPVRAPDRGRPVALLGDPGPPHRGAGLAGADGRGRRRGRSRRFERTRSPAPAAWPSCRATSGPPRPSTRRA